jgi:hypothetical protein
MVVPRTSWIRRRLIWKTIKRSLKERKRITRTKSQVLQVRKEHSQRSEKALQSMKRRETIWKVRLPY